VPNPPPTPTLKRKPPPKRLAAATWHKHQKGHKSSPSTEQTAPTSTSQMDLPEPVQAPCTQSLYATGHDATKSTPRKILLRTKLRHLQCQRWKMSRKLQYERSRILAKSTEHSSPSLPEVIQASQSYLTKLQFDFFWTQLTASQTLAKGHRWTIKEKLFFLQLYYKSPTAYRFMSQNFVLPSVSILGKFVCSALGRLDSGFSDVMFSMVKFRLMDLSVSDRQCVVVFDEMALKCQLTYDKQQDRIVGYTANSMLATHALVFMVRLHAKWKQAFAFFFTHNTVAASHLAELITECVCKLASIGLFVRCLVCDHGATNVAAVKKLGFSHESSSTFLQFEGVPHRVYVVFDVPHLLKNVRNNLQRHDIQIDDGTAYWKHIEQFYHLDKISPIRLAPKLTDRHINITCTNKMRVSLAAQVLSHSVAAGIKMRVKTNELLLPLHSLPTLWKIWTNFLICSIHAC